MTLNLGDVVRDRRLRVAGAPTLDSRVRASEAFAKAVELHTSHVTIVRGGRTLGVAAVPDIAALASSERIDRLLD